MSFIALVPLRYLGGPSHKQFNPTPRRGNDIILNVGATIGRPQNAIENLMKRAIRESPLHCKINFIATPKEIKNSTFRGQLGRLSLQHYKLATPNI